MDIQNDVIEMIRNHDIDDAWCIILDNQRDIDIPALISHIINMSGYMTNRDQLPVRRDKTLIDLAESITELCPDSTQNVLHALLYNDMAMIEFLINRGYTTACDVLLLSLIKYYSQDIVDQIEEVYGVTIDDCMSDEESP